MTRQTTRRALPSWLRPIRGLPWWRGVLRSVVWGGGGILLIREFGSVGLLMFPLLIPAVWLVEGVIMAALAVLRRWNGRGNEHRDRGSERDLRK
jgi:hypothetical protein